MTDTGRPVLLILATTFLLFCGSTTVQAAYLHPAETDTFGPDGTTSATKTFGSVNFEGNTYSSSEVVSDFAFDQTHKRLYVLRSKEVLCYSSCHDQKPPQIPRAIYGFDVSAPGQHVALGGGFPVQIDEPIRTPSFAVDESEGRLFHLDAWDGCYGGIPSNRLYAFDALGKPIGSDLDPEVPSLLAKNEQDMFYEVASDPFGNIWAVGQVHPCEYPQSKSALFKYDSDGTLLETIVTEPLSLRNIAFDRSTGDMWALGYIEFGPIKAIRLTAASGYSEYDRAFDLKSEFGGSYGVGSMDFDTEHNVLYAIGEEGVVAYNETGGVIETFGAEQRPRKLALNEDTGEIYLYNTESCSIFECTDPHPEWQNVVVYGGVVVPDVTTQQPTEIGHTGAKLHGHIDAAGGPGITECKFEYSSASAFNEVQKVTVSEEATGGTYRLFESEKVGYTGPYPYGATAAEFESIMEASLGPDSVHVTGPAGGPYLIEGTGPWGNLNMRELYPFPEGLVPSSAGLTVETIRNGGHGWDSPSIASCVPAVSPGSPVTTGTDVSADLSGLETGETYRYRLVARNSNGSNTGTEESFTAQPSLTETGGVTNLLPISATLNGTVDPEGLATTFYFEWGKTAFYGKTTAPEPGESVGTTEAGAKPVSAGITGLIPGVGYHYRLIAVNSKGKSYGLDRNFTAAAAVKNLSTDPATDVDRVTATLNGTLDPNGLQTNYYFEYGKTKGYGQTTSAPPGADVGTTAAGDIPLSLPISGLDPESTYHYRLVASNTTYGTTYGGDRTFTTLTSVLGVETDPATGIGTSTATLHGKLDPDNHATTYYFDWGKTSFYGHTFPAPPGPDVGSTTPGATPVASPLADLEAGTTYHFRLVGVNQFGSSFGPDRSFSTPEPPSIEGVFSDNVTGNSAVLKGRVNPNGYETKYSFEYGTTVAYGSVAPVPDGVLAAGTSGQGFAISINGLQGVTYHFRLIAENQWGEVTSDDQTLDFNPPNCPNSAVRQQTGAAYVPDCRAYELVSPARAGGAILIPEAPTSPTANNRFGYAGWVNAIPGAGDPPNGGLLLPIPDLYVATRTTSGWSSRYVGIPANEVQVQGGPPYPEEAEGGLPGGILADANMDRFLTWNNSLGSRSYAPYLWDGEGKALGRLPTNVDEVPDATTSLLDGGFLGDMKPSGDYHHYVFSSIRTAFAPGGLTASPGSVYDNDLDAKTLSVVSKTAAGADLPQDPAAGLGSDEFIHIPGVSEDGSHILMATYSSPPPTNKSEPPALLHLYMRVDNSVTYEISVAADSVNRGVKFDSMSPDGSEVYFTTTAKMTSDDHDTSADLYRWSENGGSPQITRLSKGSEGSGDKSSCSNEWGSGCSVEVVSTERGGLLTPGIAAQAVDTAVASQSGDVYFYSPEELDGARGVAGKRNLYVSRGGAVQHVATLGAGPEEGAVRINVSPDGSHMAFITKTQLTAYDNDGHFEMYTYDAASRKVLCVSCRPDGTPPDSDVLGSQNGIFMTDDGRAFFSTRDALVPRDANGIADVYEYVDGRAQLISTGTGEHEGDFSFRKVGLVGVSADGTNAFFSTYQTLVGQDENGSFYKFYDARVGGGFPFNKPPAPCAAADECHGAGSSTTAPLQIGSGADLGAGGNAKSTPAKKKKRKGKRSKQARHKKHHQKKARRVGAGR